MNADKRAKILGEKVEQTKSDNKFVSQQVAPIGDNEPQIMIDLPFNDDWKKVLRFKAYVLEQ